MTLRVLPLLLLAFSASCATSSTARLNPRPESSVAILHFNDVYEIDATEAGLGGLSRVATLVQRLKNGGQPVLTTLGGDFLSPSAIGTARLNGERLAGRQMVDILNRIGLDWATLGNHEFDLSEAAFKTRLAEARFKIVVSNVTAADGRPFENTVPRAIIPVRANGRTMRLGLFGVVLDMNRQPWVRYSSPIDAAREQVAALAGQVDAIIALTHLRLDQDEELAVAVPEIDVLLGGHEHENWAIARGPRLTPIVKADANVRSVAVVTLDFGRPGSRPVVSSRLQPVDAGVPMQPDVQAVVTRWMDTAFEAFKADGLSPRAVVVNTPVPLDGREATIRNGPGLLTDIITASFLRECKEATIGILNGGSIRIDDVLPAGPVREYDLIRILPFGGKVVQATLDGDLLVRVLDAGVANKGSGGFLHVAGVTRGTDGWLAQGKPIEPAGRYVVATTDFLLTGLESRLDFLTTKNPQVRDVREFRDIRHIVIDELKARYGR